MTDSQNISEPKNPDEIDLGQLLQMIKRVFNRLFRSFLRLFLFLKKNAFILIGLILLGGGIGYGLNKMVPKRMKTEIIVKPSAESTDYLYDVVNEIQANIASKNKRFFETLGVDLDQIEGFEITIEPIEEEDNRANFENDIKYLELLEKFKTDEFVTEVVKSEILHKSTLNHRITFYYRQSQKENNFVEQLIKYIESNVYFNDLSKIYTENAKERITQNQKLIAQIDGLVESVSKKMASDLSNVGPDRIVFGTEEKSEVGELLILKDKLIKDIELSKLQVYEKQTSIRILNLGRPQQVKKSILGKNIVLFPTIFIGAFFLWSILLYFNRKAKDLT